MMGLMAFESENITPRGVSDGELELTPTGQLKGLNPYFNSGGEGEKE